MKTNCYTCLLNRKAKNPGICYRMSYQEGLYGVCYFFCIATGGANDYCSSFYVNLVNFCTMIGGI